MICGSIGSPSGPRKDASISTTSSSPYPAAQAFKFWSGRLHPETGSILREDDVAHYRYDCLSTAGMVIDAVWYRALFDGDAGTRAVTVNPPTGAASGTQYDALGNALMTNAGGQAVMLQVGQAPVLIVWR